MGLAEQLGELVEFFIAELLFILQGFVLEAILDFAGLFE